MPAPTLPLSTNEKNHLVPALPGAPAAGAAGEGPAWRGACEDGRPSLARGLGPCQHRCPRASSQPLAEAVLGLGVSSGATHGLSVWL